MPGKAKGATAGTKFPALPGNAGLGPLCYGHGHGCVLVKNMASLAPPDLGGFPYPTKDQMSMTNGLPGGAAGTAVGQMNMPTSMPSAQVPLKGGSACYYSGVHDMHAGYTGVKNC
eukprot:Hpha_TRINITY_DN35108_c0_g1::TRINITY_DN35108_c0_g1_i1::g.168410::m.168410